MYMQRYYNPYQELYKHLYFEALKECLRHIVYNR